MATALELPLGVENEAKFIALRNLHMKKIKQLMTSLDGKDKEIAKLKILGKDNRRTQMIQALRDKIRDLELINDVVKEELVRKSESTVDEVNELIIKKTLAGPKRFRPLSREELENKITELEKKINKKTISNASNNNQNQEEAKSSDPAANTVNSMSQSKTPSNKYGDDSKGTTSAGGGGLLDANMLFDEMQKVKATLSAKDSLINTQRDEIVRLRARNGELVAAEEEIEHYERQYQDMKDQNEILLRSLEDANIKLAEALENANKYKSEANLTAEYEHTELMSLQQQCEKLLKQNANLLKSLSDAENALEKYEDETTRSKVKTASTESTLHSKDSKLKSLEDKLSKAEDKIKQLEAKCQALETENTQIPVLKDQLREKNITIKEIKRNMEEREKVLQLKSAKALPPDHPNSAAGKAPLRPSSPTHQLQPVVAEEKEEKRTSDAAANK